MLLFQLSQLNHPFSFLGPYHHPVPVKLELANPTGDTITYKVKCTDSMHYAVKPAVGTIAPGHQQTITVALFPLSGPSRKPDVILFDPFRQFFAVLAAKVSKGIERASTVPPSSENTPTAATLALKRAEEKGELMEAKLRCTFDDPQLAAALEDSTKSAVPSIRTNPVDRSVFNGMPSGSSPATGLNNNSGRSTIMEQISAEDEMTVVYVIGGLVALLALIYAVYYFH